jgi:hypothetical protein
MKEGTIHQLAAKMRPMASLYSGMGAYRNGLRRRDHVFAIVSARHLFQTGPQSIYLSIRACVFAPALFSVTALHAIFLAFFFLLAYSTFSVFSFIFYLK